MLIISCSVFSISCVVRCSCRTNLLLDQQDAVITAFTYKRLLSCWQLSGAAAPSVSRAWSSEEVAMCLWQDSSSQTPSCRLWFCCLKLSLKLIDDFKERFCSVDDIIIINCTGGSHKFASHCLAVMMETALMFIRVHPLCFCPQCLFASIFPSFSWFVKLMYLHCFLFNFSKKIKIKQEILTKLKLKNHNVGSGFHESWRPFVQQRV